MPHEKMRSWDCCLTNCGRWEDSVEERKERKDGFFIYVLCEFVKKFLRFIYYNFYFSLMIARENVELIELLFIN